MMRLSQTIRRKPDWVSKMKDENIVAKWKAEAWNAFENLTYEETAREAIEFVLSELDWYAIPNIHEPEYDGRS